MPKYIDITGQRYGRLTVLREAGRQPIKPHGWQFMCQCDCGNQKVISSNKLRTGHTTSCGCLRIEKVIRASKETAHLRAKHGHTSRNGEPTRSHAYNSWQAMIQRCTNPKNKAFKNYGGRGISVYERWLIFENFLADMGEPPKGKTLDRYPDNDGNYEPGNCRWATRAEQKINARRRGAKFTDRTGKLITGEAADSATFIL